MDLLYNSTFLLDSPESVHGGTLEIPKIFPINKEILVLFLFISYFKREK